VIVDNNLCLHCGACVGTCPSNAIFLRGTSRIVFTTACSRCGLCTIVCPVGAIDANSCETKQCGTCSSQTQGKECAQANG